MSDGKRKACRLLRGNEGRSQLQSKSGVHRLIVALEERGFIKRMPNGPRFGSDQAARIAFAQSRRQADRFTPNVIQGHLGKVKPMPASNDAWRARDRAADGADRGGRSPPPPSRITPATSRCRRKCWAAAAFRSEVKANSMIEAAFSTATRTDRKGDTANNGEIVVALIDDEEATLKRLRRKGDSVALEAPMPHMKPASLGPDRVRVQGSLVGLLVNTESEIAISLSAASLNSPA